MISREDVLTVLGLLLGLIGLVGLLALSWVAGSRPAKPGQRDWLVDAETHKRRVEDNKAIAAGRLRDIEQRRGA